MKARDVMRHSLVPKMSDEAVDKVLVALLDVAPREPVVIMPDGTLMRAEQLGELDGWYQLLSVEDNDEPAS